MQKLQKEERQGIFGRTRSDRYASRIIGSFKSPGSRYAADFKPLVRRSLAETLYECITECRGCRRDLCWNWVT
jgi:hypothetical protein